MSREVDDMDRLSEEEYSEAWSHEIPTFGFYRYREDYLAGILDVENHINADLYLYSDVYSRIQNKEDENRRIRLLQEALDV